MPFNRRLNICVADCGACPVPPSNTGGNSGGGGGGGGGSGGSSYARTITQNQTDNVETTALINEPEIKSNETEDRIIEDQTTTKGFARITGAVVGVFSKGKRALAFIFTITIIGAGLSIIIWRRRKKNIEITNITKGILRLKS